MCQQEQKPTYDSPLTGTLGLTPNAPNNNKGIPPWANVTAVPVSFMPEQRSPPVSSLSINRGKSYSISLQRNTREHRSPPNTQIKVIQPKLLATFGTSASVTRCQAQ